MMHARWALTLALSVGLVACGGEEPSKVDPSADQDGGSGSDLADPAAQDPVDAVTDGVEDAVEKVEDTAEKAKTQADDLISQITGYLEQDKLELAKTALA